MCQGFFLHGFFMILPNLFLLLLVGHASAQSLAPNSANVEVQSNINMTITAEQTGGGCWAGYSWHQTYGGCRRQVLEQVSEQQACASGFTGQQSRINTRHNYIQQGTNATASSPWTQGSWDSSSCVKEPKAPPKLPPNPYPESVMVDKASGTSFGGGSTTFALLMLHKPTGLFWCKGEISSTEVGPGVQAFEYPSSGVVTFGNGDMATRCQIQGNGAVGATALLEGSGAEGFSKSVQIRIQAISADECTYTLNRTGNPGPINGYWQDFYIGNTVNACGG